MRLAARSRDAAPSSPRKGSAPSKLLAELALKLKRSSAPSDDEGDANDVLELPSPRQYPGQASLVGAARVQRLGFQCQLGQRLGLLESSDSSGARQCEQWMMIFISYVT